MHCTGCGTEQPDRAGFCTQCGTRLEAPVAAQKSAPVDLPVATSPPPPGPGAAPPPPTFAPPPGPAFALPPLANQGAGPPFGTFFGWIFDLSFRSFLTPASAKVLYIFAMVGSGIWAALTLWAAANSSNGLGALILFALAPAIFVVPVGFARAFLEFLLARNDRPGENLG